MKPMQWIKVEFVQFKNRNAIKYRWYCGTELSTCPSSFSLKSIDIITF